MSTPTVLYGDTDTILVDFDGMTLAEIDIYLDGVNNPVMSTPEIEYDTMAESELMLRRPIIR